jgi:hypothetical protein
VVDRGDGVDALAGQELAEEGPRLGGLKWPGVQAVHHEEQIPPLARRWGEEGVVSSGAGEKWVVSLGR